MTAKDKIDKFIGEIPDLLIINKDLRYQFSAEKHINEAYWRGYIHAKEELRDKLYRKENITPIQKKISEWSPDFNLTIFGEHIYEK